MRSPTVRAGTALALFVLGLAPLLYHAGLLMGRWTPLASALIFIQLLVVCALVSLRSAPRYARLAVGAVSLLLAAICWQSAQLGIVAASAIPHALTYLALLTAFGATLLPGRVALVTALTRRLSGPVPDEVAAYTRRVTWAWCGFFAAQLGVSLVLFLTAPLAVWSLFVNVLNFPLLVLMFAAEYGYRVLRVPNRPRHRLADIMVIIAYVKGSVLKPAKSA